MQGVEASPHHLAQHRGGGVGLVPKDPYVLCETAYGPRVYAVWVAWPSMEKLPGYPPLKTLQAFWREVFTSFSHPTTIIASIELNTPAVEPTNGYCAERSHGLACSLGSAARSQ